MSWLDKLVGGSVAEPVEAVGNALDKLFTSDDERLTHQEILTRLQQKPAELQVELNKIEAGHRSIFVAGWRPALGWVCAVGFAFPFLINPCLQWYSGMPGPALPLDAMTELVIAMLGLGGLRTFEKLKGKSK